MLNFWLLYFHFLEPGEHIFAAVAVELDIVMTNVGHNMSAFSPAALRIAEHHQKSIELKTVSLVSVRRVPLVFIFIICLVVVVVLEGAWRHSCIWVTSL